MISSRFASTAAARRALTASWGGAGVVSVSEEPATRPPGWSALDRQRRLRDHDERQDEEPDLRGEDLVQAEHNEQGGHEEHPEAPADRPGPVATIGDPAMSGEDDQPEQHRRHEPGR